MRALLVGINHYQKLPLRGCINDVRLMQAVLQERFGVAETQLRVLLDADATRQAILEGLTWLAEPDPTDGPHAPLRLFHYSGHGIQLADPTGTEPDGKTEAIACFDYATAGSISDDTLREYYNRFDPAMHLILTMDCCHSGDIHYVPEADVVNRFLDPDEAEQERIRAAQMAYIERRSEHLAQLESELRARGVSGIELRTAIRAAEAAYDQPQPRPTTDVAILVAAAREDQPAADARFGEQFYGAMTYYLTQLLRESPTLPSYTALIQELRQRLLDARFSQQPQLDGNPVRLELPFLTSPVSPCVLNEAEKNERSGVMSGAHVPDEPPTPPPPDEPLVSNAIVLAGDTASRSLPTGEPASGDDPRAELWDGNNEDEYVDAVPDDFLEGLLPAADASDEGSTERQRGQFLYIGKGLTAAQFTAYVREYNFGSQPPSFIVLHHTAVPDTRHARMQHATWDSGEEGLSAEAIYAKRLGQLTAVKNHYQNEFGWGIGPHLFIDERYIWLFSPMYYQGIHAAEGNGDGRGTYSIGIEVIGNYTNVRWPEQVERLVGHAVAVLKDRLGTFDLVHKRGRGGISGHRDYNKPSCPGDAITNEYYMSVLQREWNRLQAAKNPPANTPLDRAMPLLGAASGTLQQVIDYVQARLPGQSEYRKDVAVIFGLYWQYAPSVGVDPFLAACQCVFETDALRSQWAARPRRNPAGLGVRQEGGLSFATWDEAVQAHIGQLLALALRDEEASDAQRAMMQRNPRHAHVKAEARGTVKTVGGLDGTWNGSPDYAEALLVRMRAIRGA